MDAKLGLRGPNSDKADVHLGGYVNKGVITSVPICWMQACVIAGRIAFTSFHLHDNVGEQCDTYQVLAFADAEVKVFQLLASKTQRVKSSFSSFTWALVVKGQLLVSKIGRENDLNVQSFWIYRKVTNHTNSNRLDYIIEKWECVAEFSENRSLGLSLLLPQLLGMCICYEQSLKLYISGINSSRYFVQYVKWTFQREQSMKSPVIMYSTWSAHAELRFKIFQRFVSNFIADYNYISHYL